MLAFVGKDRLGIVAKISHALFDMQGNLGETSMTRLGNIFTIMLLSISENFILRVNCFKNCHSERIDESCLWFIEY
jgi:predicted amino acid-binding ACT domain protein